VRTDSEGLLLIVFFFSLLADGVQRLKDAARRKKGRGFAPEGTTRTDVKHYEGMDVGAGDDDVGPQRCK
jgi:hypothetical protein